MSCQSTSDIPSSVAVSHKLHFFSSIHDRLLSQTRTPTSFESVCISRPKYTFHRTKVQSESQGSQRFKPHLNRSNTTPDIASRSYLRKRTRTPIFDVFHFFSLTYECSDTQTRPPTWFGTNFEKWAKVHFFRTKVQSESLRFKRSKPHPNRSILTPDIAPQSSSGHWPRTTTFVLPLSPVDMRRSDAQAGAEHNSTTSNDPANFKSLRHVLVRFYSRATLWKNSTSPTSTKQQFVATLWRHGKWPNCLTLIETSEYTQHMVVLQCLEFDVSSLFTSCSVSRQKWSTFYLVTNVHFVRSFNHHSAVILTVIVTKLAQSTEHNLDYTFSFQS